MKINRLFIPNILLLVFFASCSVTEEPEVSIDEPYDKNIHDIYIQNDVVYVATFNEGLYYYENEKWSKFTEEDGLISNSQNTVAVSTDGVIYAGTQLGLSIYENGGWSSLTTDNGLYSNTVKSLTFGPDGNLWIGTGRNRICKYDGSKVVDTMHVSPDASGPGEMGHIHTICFDKSGNLWTGSCISGLSKYDGTSWTDSILNLGVFVESSICASNGDIWIGHTSGAYQLKNGNWIKHDTETGLANNIVLDFAIDKNNNVWVATEEGLSKYDGAQWKTFTTEDGLPDNYIKAIACDANGIWVGAGGLVHLDF